VVFVKYKKWITEKIAIFAQKSKPSYMIQLTNTILQQKPSYLNFLLNNLTDTYAHLFYELVFVANVKTNNVEYLSPYSGLSNKLAKYQLQNRTFPFIVEIISEKKGVMLLPFLIDVISKKHKEMELVDRENTIYLTDMPMVLNEGENYATYRILPLTESCDGDLIHIVVVISHSVCEQRDKILSINLKKGERLTFDINSKTWSESYIPTLTPIEKSVLAMSAQGLSVMEIASELHKAVDTIKSVRKRIFHKLEVDNITKAIMKAVIQKII